MTVTSNSWTTLFPQSSIFSLMVGNSCFMHVLVTMITLHIVAAASLCTTPLRASSPPSGCWGVTACALLRAVATICKHKTAHFQAVRCMAPTLRFMPKCSVLEAVGRADDMLTDANDVHLLYRSTAKGIICALNTQTWQSSQQG